MTTSLFVIYVLLNYMYRHAFAVEFNDDDDDVKETN